MKNKFTIKNFFKFQSLNTTIKKELIGGLSTFLSLIYIVSVQKEILGSADSPNFKINAGEIFLATAIAMFVCTIIVGLSANAPIAVAPGMGLNAMFTYNVANEGLGFSGALIATFISSILLTIVCSTKLRDFIVKAIPESLHLSIGIGLGFFTAYLGLMNMHWVQQSGGIPIASIENMKLFYPAIILGTTLFFLALFLFIKKIAGGVAITIFTGLIIAVILANSTNAKVIQDSFGSSKYMGWSYDEFNGFGDNIKNSWKDFTDVTIWKSPLMYTSIFLFTLICFFDTVGGVKISSLSISDDKEYRDVYLKKTLIAVGISSVASATLGTSPAIATLESNIGVSQGARTGFASVVTGLLFLILIPLYPIFRLMPPTVIGSTSLFIGACMVMNIKELDFKKMDQLIPFFMLVLFMVVTYSLTNGIAMGIITYVIISLLIGKAKTISPTLWILFVVFISYFIITALTQ